MTSAPFPRTCPLELTAALRSQLFDIFSHFSQYADLRFETYPRLLCDGPPSDKCDGLAELEEAATSDHWFGKERNRRCVTGNETRRSLTPAPN
jgi:hypothetical protein